MIAAGTKLKFESGNRYRVSGVRAVGQQFITYDAIDCKTGAAGIVKCLKSEFDIAQTESRTRFLIDQGLPSPPICAPVDLCRSNGDLAHFAPLAPGVDLEEFLPTVSCGLTAQLQLGLAIARALQILEDRVIAHGDIHAGNFKLVVGPDGVLRVWLIDLDNFVAPRIAPPACIGQQWYLAPDLRLGLKRGKPILPTMQSDRYAMAVLVQEVVLLRHPGVGADHDPDEFEKVMTAGHWPADPMIAAFRPDLGGYPAQVLNPALSQLFRRGFSLEGDGRPTAREWATALNEALYQVGECPSCSRPFIVDATKTICPYPDCGKPAPLLKLVVPGVSEVALGRITTAIGRGELGGSMKVSARHAQLLRIGPEYWIESIGSNGTYRWNGSAWLPLPRGQRFLLEVGDRLRFADVEGRIVQA